MADNKNDANKAQVRKKKQASTAIEIAKAVVLLALFALFALVILNNRDMLTAQNARVVLSYLDFSGANEDKLSDNQIRFFANNQSRYATFKNQFCAISTDGLRIFQGYNAEESFFSMASESPVLLSAQRFLLAYDYGKNFINVFNSNGLVKNIIYDYPVQCASLNDSGYFAVATGARGYKGNVLVYDRNMNTVFQWLISDGYVGDIALSPSNAELCGALVIPDGGKISTNLVLYKLDSENPFKTVSLQDTMIIDVAYKDPNLIAAVSPTAFFLYDGKGEQVQTYTYSGGYLWTYSLEARRYNVFCTAQNVLGENITVHVVDNTGAEVSRFSVAASVKDVEVNDQGIVLLTSSKLLHMDFEGQLLAEVDVFSDVREIVLSENGAYLVSLGMAQYIRL